MELILRWVVGIIFVYASYHKILAPAHFAKIIYGYYLFPDASINIIAIVLPFVELYSGIFLILGIFPRSAVLLINILLLMFIIAISINLIRGQEFDCGCFSFGEPGYTSSAEQLLLRNMVLLLVGGWILFYNLPRKWCVRQNIRNK
ncbi:MauE/DoxX family redox-associated membrane protein [Thermodesulfobacteriota bacterium]